MRFDTVFRGKRTTVRVNNDVWDLFVEFANAGDEEAAQEKFLLYFVGYEGLANFRGLTNSEAANEVCKNLIRSRLREHFQSLPAGSARNSRAHDQPELPGL